MLITTNNIHEILLSFDKESVNFLTIGEHTSIDIQGLINAANEDGYIIAGGIFPMVIHDNQSYKEGIVLKHVSSAQPPVLIKKISESDFEKQLPDINEEIQSCIIMLDGLMANVSGFLEKLYEKYWNKFSYIGAGAGSLSLEQTPCVFTNEGFYQDAAILLLSQVKSKLSVSHGWSRLAGPFIANKTEGNKIIELNWRPAFDVYREVVERESEESFDNIDFFNLAKGYPFGIYREGHEDIIRDPIAMTPKGELNCVGAVGQNVLVHIMQGKPHDLIGSAENAAKKAINGSVPSDIFVVDCISRVLYLEEDFTQELGAVKKAFAAKQIQLPVEGVLSLGEISTGKGGFLELYNKTIVVSTFN